MKEIIVRDVILGRGVPKICVPIVGRTETEILEQARQLSDLPADLTEWRVDWYEFWKEEDRLRGILQSLREVLGDLPLLVTFRTGFEGGACEISEEEYRNLNLWLAERSEIDLLDVEVFREQESVEKIIGKAHEHGIRIIASNHDFASTPSEAELVRRLKYMEEQEADMAKIAVMPQTEQDVLTLLAASIRGREELSCPVITMSMGPTGAVSRVCGEFSGSAVTFAAAKKASAPGQIGALQMQYLLEVLHKSLENQ